MNPHNFCITRKFAGQRARSIKTEIRFRREIPESSVNREHERVQEWELEYNIRMPIFETFCRIQAPSKDMSQGRQEPHGFV
jgi:hypothetical protein